jgi:hypothetical protein
MNFRPRSVALAWMAATLFSGAPSTLHALATRGDPLEATWAAGHMLLDSGSPGALLAAAAIVHCAVSAFWALVAATVLPRRHTLLWALGFSAAVGAFDLLLVAPQWFPSVAALSAGPQMADHLMWGACLGGVLQAWQPRSTEHRSPPPA